MDGVKVELVGREVIKPASPSPQDHIQLSIFDLTCPSSYVQMILFYKVEDLAPEITSKKLKTSLSKTLSRFYPLAGRIEGISISCNDEGAIFDEARTDLLLPEFLKNLNTNSLNEFLPKIEPGYYAAEWPLLTVKVTYFGSGSGVAISVSVSHKICDATSLFTFFKEWATTTTTTTTTAKDSTIWFPETTIYPPPSPSFIFPQSLPFDTVLDPKKRIVTKRFVFESSKIAELKRKNANESVQVPTRVEVITSLIWRCARNASSHSHSNNNLVIPRSTSICNAVDLRPRIPSTVLAPDAISNLQTLFFLKKGAESDELEIHETVAAFRKGKERVNDMIKENLETNTLAQSLLIHMGNLVSEFKPDVDEYITTSWCRKPFYEVDFGWGTPVWLEPAVQSLTVTRWAGIIILIDSKDSVGVEAWISLPEQDMSVFVHDQELLAYAVLNPPVLI